MPLLHNADWHDPRREEAKPLGTLRAALIDGVGLAGLHLHRAEALWEPSLGHGLPRGLGTTGSGTAGPALSLWGVELLPPMCRAGHAVGTPRGRGAAGSSVLPGGSPYPGKGGHRCR